MNRTPLLRPLRENGATLYVFPSASEDIGLNLDSRSTGVALSHYALLNFPTFNLTSSTTDKNEALAEDLQNYLMNFETLLLNQKNYNYQEYHTVTERVFWHWVTKQEMLNLDSSDGIYFSESDQNSKVVKCFGSIDAGNTLSTEFGMFNETYINIPTSYGNGPVVFKEVQDPGETNYIRGKQYEYGASLEGRDDNTILDTLKILKNITPTGDSDTYYEASNAYEIVKDVYQIQKALSKQLNKTDLILNSYDDINVDERKQFEGTKYDITSNPVEFDFNAILLYYSVYDQDDPTKSAYAVNLFGIIFLNGVDNNNNIIGLTKRKSFESNSNGNFFGNSYSFRVNLKTLSVYDNTDAVIMDNTTMSSIYSIDLSDVISNLNRAIDVMNTNVQSTISIQDQYMDILRYYNDQNVIIEDISNKVHGFINGSKTSSFNTALLRTNDIKPLDDESNIIKLSLFKKEYDGKYVGNRLYENSKYIPPIIIANDLDTFNMPTTYKPVLNSSYEIQGEVIDSSGQIQDIIDHMDVSYFTDSQYTYQKLNIPEEIITSYNFTNIYKYFPDYSALENSVDSSLLYVNYDSIVLLLLKYVKLLHNDIELLKVLNSDLMEEINELKNNNG